MPISKSHWVNDANVDRCLAPECAKQFSLVERRHHCRRCGWIYCKSCLRFELWLTDSGDVTSPAAVSSTSYRVCLSCWCDSRTGDCATATALGMPCPRGATSSPVVSYVAIVGFDLAVGQVVELLRPHSTSSGQHELEVAIADAAFPDSHNLPADDCDELFPVLIPIFGGSSLVGASFYRQRRVPEMPRSAFQKAVVVLSTVPYLGLLARLAADIGRTLVPPSIIPPSPHGSASQAVPSGLLPLPAETIDAVDMAGGFVSILAPAVGTALRLPWIRTSTIEYTVPVGRCLWWSHLCGCEAVRGTILTPRRGSLGAIKMVSASAGSETSARKPPGPSAPVLSPAFSEGALDTSAALDADSDVELNAEGSVHLSGADGEGDRSGDDPLRLSMSLQSWPLTARHLDPAPDPFSVVSIAAVLHRNIRHVFKLWELVMRGDSICVFSASTRVASAGVIALVSLVAPLAVRGLVRPLVNVGSTEFNALSLLGHEMTAARSGIVLGMTNPFVAAVAAKYPWPAIVCLSSRDSSSGAFGSSLDTKVPGAALRTFEDVVESATGSRAAGGQKDAKPQCEPVPDKVFFDEKRTFTVKTDRDFLKSITVHPNDGDVLRVCGTDSPPSAILRPYLRSLTLTFVYPVAHTLCAIVSSNLRSLLCCSDPSFSHLLSGVLSPSNILRYLVVPPQLYAADGPLKKWRDPGQFYADFMCSAHVQPLFCFFLHVLVRTLILGHVVCPEVCPSTTSPVSTGGFADAVHDHFKHPPSATSTPPRIPVAPAPTIPSLLSPTSASTLPDDLTSSPFVPANADSLVNALTEVLHRSLSLGTLPTGATSSVRWKSFLSCAFITADEYPLLRASLLGHLKMANEASADLPVEAPAGCSLDEEEAGLMSPSLGCAMLGAYCGALDSNRSFRNALVSLLEFISPS